MRTWLILSTLLFVCSDFSVAANQEDTLKTAWNYYKTGDCKEAIRFFERVLHVSPDSHEAYIGIGSSYMKIGDNASATDVEMVIKAIQAFNMALQKNQDLPEIRYKIGLAHLLMDDKTAAEKQLSELEKVVNPYTEQLAAKIASHKMPEKYEYLYNENNLMGDLRDLELDQLRRQKAIAVAQAEEFAKRQREIARRKAAQDAAVNYDYRPRPLYPAARVANDSAIRASRAGVGVGVNPGAINPYTGEYYAPSGQGYVGTRDGTYYAPAGPNGVINTRSGTFIPVH